MESSFIFIRYMGQCVTHVELRSPFMKWFVICLQYPWSSVHLLCLVMDQSWVRTHWWYIRYCITVVCTSSHRTLLWCYPNLFVLIKKKNSDYASLHPACSSDCQLCHRTLHANQGLN